MYEAITKHYDNYIVVCVTRSHVCWAIVCQR